MTMNTTPNATTTKACHSGKSRAPPKQISARRAKRTGVGLTQYPTSRTPTRTGAVPALRPPERLPGPGAPSPESPPEQSPPEALAPLRLQLLPERCGLLLGPPVLGLQPGALLLQLLRPLLGLQTLGALPLHVGAALPALTLEFLPERALRPLRQLQAGPQLGVLRDVGLQARQGLPDHVHRCLPNEFRRDFRRTFWTSGSTADLPRQFPLLVPPVAQGVQTVHGDHIPLVYAVFLLTAYQVAVKYVIANGPGGNTQGFCRDIGVYPSGSSRVVSPVLPSVHAVMVAASR